MREVMTSVHNIHKKIFPKKVNSNPELVETAEDYEKMDRSQLIQLLNKSNTQTKNLKQELSNSESETMKKLFDKAIVIDRLRKKLDVLDDQYQEVNNEANKLRHDLQAENVNYWLLYEEKDEDVARLKSTIAGLTSFLRTKEIECDELLAMKCPDSTRSNKHEDLLQMKNKAEEEKMKALNQWADMSVRYEYLKKENSLLKKKIDISENSQCETKNNYRPQLRNQWMDKSNHDYNQECEREKRIENTCSAYSSTTDERYSLRNQWMKSQSQRVWRRGSHIQIKKVEQSNGMNRRNDNI